MSTADQGYIALTWFDSGARSFYTVDTPINTISLRRFPTRPAPSSRRLPSSAPLPRQQPECDFLYQMNVKARERLAEMGAEVTYSETPGAMHNWDYWNEEICKILDWMTAVHKSVKMFLTVKNIRNRKCLVYR